MRSSGVCALTFAAAANAAFVGSPLAAQPAATQRHASAAHAPTMIIDQLKEAAKAVEGAAVETVVEKKVADKLAKAREKYDIPDKYVGVMGGFFTSYMTEVYKKAGGDMERVDHYEGVLTDLFKKVLECAKEPHKFAPFHEAIREPFDYYALGNEFATGVINSDTSEIIGEAMLEKIQAQVAAGDNVVLLANHQSEADPQIFSVLLDPVVPGFAEKTIFVAGDRVTTDLLAQPFSMGRNLLCIFSKKHIENPPEQKSEKSRHNRNVMKRMQELFKEGGKVIWVAPSGGRDRVDPDTDRYAVAPFDSKSVEMFRLMADKAGRTTHFYPLSMLTYNVCPPPTVVGGAVGESRTVKWSPAGLHFGEEIDLAEFAAGCVVDDFPAGCEQSPRDVLRDALSEHIHGIVSDNYKGLEEKLAGKLD